MARAWVRRLGKNGNAYSVVLPVEALRAMGWEKGDHLLIHPATTKTLAIYKFKPSELPDRVRAACAEIPNIHA